MNVDTWTPGRIVDHLLRGLIVPSDWRERLERAGYEIPPVQLSFQPSAAEAPPRAGGPTVETGEQ